MPKITIEHILIEGARKDRDFFTNKSYKADNDDHASEWAVAVGSRAFSNGQTVEQQEFINAVMLAKVQQTLDFLVESGLMLAIWDPEQGCVVYSVSEEGEEAVNELG